MDWDECAETDRNVMHAEWLAIYMHKRKEELPSWISTFHPENLQCSLVHDHVENDPRGSFNVGCKVRFTDGAIWMARFPRGGKVILADEKVAAEVATITVVRNQTTIPVPEIMAWGLAADNTLGIGPFIITNYVEGESLGKVLQGSDSLMRHDVSDETIKTLLRQVACIMLQLSKLDFACIGNLSTEPGDDSYAATVQSRPLTLKAQDILQLGGVDTLCPPTTTFSSTSGYLTYLADQDLQHLTAQPNSVDDENDARNKYVYWNVMKTLVSRFVSHETDHGPFKLICDDFGLANMLVDKEYRILLVLDWEWSYAGPEELFWSPPRWLVFEAPNAWTGEMEGKLTRYNNYLEIYITMVEEQEKAILGKQISKEKRPSYLLRQRQQDGSMWFYHIMRDSFNGPTLMPYQKLRAAVPDFDELAAIVPENEVAGFVERKKHDLQRYPELLGEKMQWKERIATGKEQIPDVKY